MSNRFVDNVTPLDGATLNQFEEDMKRYVEEQSEPQAATQTSIGGVKIWISGTVLNISTN